MRNLVVALVLGFGQIVAFASAFYLLGVLGAPIALSLALPETLPSSLLSAAFLMSAFAGPLAGRWLDARGGREVLLASSVVFAVSLLLIAAARDAILLGAGVAGLGLGMSIGLYGSACALLVQIHGDAARPWITWVTLLGGFGSTVGWLLTGWLEASFGWRAAAAAWAGVHLFLVLPAVAAVAPRHRSPAPAAGLSAKSRPRLGWDRRMLQLAVLFAGAWFVSTCVSAHLPALYVRLGLGARDAALAASLLGVAAVSARLLDLAVLQRRSPVATARIAALLHPVGAAAVLLIGAPAAVLLTVGQGAGNGLLSVANATLPLVLFGKESYGWRSALLNTPARFVQGAGPAAFGAALAISPAAALALTSGVCLIMALCTFGLERRTP